MAKKRTFKAAAYGSLLYAILTIPAGIIWILRPSHPDSLLIRPLLILFSVLFIPVVLMAIKGYLMLAKENKYPQLRRYSLVIFTLICLQPIILVIQYFISITAAQILGIVLAVVFGIIEILLGLNIHKLKETSFQSSKAIGVLYIIKGIIECTIYLIILSPILEIILRIIEGKSFFNKANSIK